MHASSIGWAIEIEISKEELKRLKEKALEGLVKRYYEELDMGEIPLKIQRGKTGENNLLMDLSTTPKGTYWEKAKNYKIIISDIAYKQLKERGSAGERLYRNPECRILIKVEQATNTSKVHNF